LKLLIVNVWFHKKGQGTSSALPFFCSTSWPQKTLRRIITRFQYPHPACLSGAFSAPSLQAFKKRATLSASLIKDKCNMSIADLRKDYSRASLSELDVAADPIVQFSSWFDEAVSAEIAEPNAMSVATVGVDGKPSSRIVLLKQVDASGFTWFTNYHSRKGLEIAQHPYVALLFHWVELERQVRVEGKIERVSAVESDAYFSSRPLKSQLGAIASQQSQLVDRRETLEQQFTATEQQYGSHPLRPEHWGVYRDVPEHIEFWQGRPSRLHDRVTYTRAADGSWLRQRLQP